MPPLPLRHNIQWLPTRCSQKGTESPSRAVDKKFNSEEDKPDHLHANHPECCIPFGGGSALHLDSASYNFIQVITQLRGSFNYYLSSVHEFLDYGIVNKLMLFLNMLIVLSYPVNFGIYCSLSR